jgi:putative transcriptional regulator
MAKAANPTSPKPSATRSGKLPDKSAVRQALDSMDFDAESLLRAASGLSADLASGRKLTRHHVKIAQPEAFDPAKIVAIRKHLDMSQSVFASVLGVTPASVMNWEYGRRIPSGPVRRLLLIASRRPEVLLDIG